MQGLTQDQSGSILLSGLQWAVTEGRRPLRRHQHSECEERTSTKTMLWKRKGEGGDLRGRNCRASLSGYGESGSGDWHGSQITFPGGWMEGRERHFRKRSLLREGEEGR